MAKICTFKTFIKQVSCDQEYSRTMRFIVNRMFLEYARKFVHISIVLFEKYISIDLIIHFPLIHVYCNSQKRSNTISFAVGNPQLQGDHVSWVFSSPAMLWLRQMRQTDFIVNKNHPGLLSLLMSYLFSLLKKQQEVAMMFSQETTLLTLVDNNWSTSSEAI